MPAVTPYIDLHTSPKQPALTSTTTAILTLLGQHLGSSLVLDQVLKERDGPLCFLRRQTS